MKINNSLSVGLLLVGAIALSAGMPVTAPAQEMTRAQQEVWEWEQGCLAAYNTEDLENFMACFHEDFLGWGRGSSVPSSKANRRPFYARRFETTEMVFVFLNPLSVTVRGDMAVIIYLATTTTRNRSTDEETTATDRWTDIAIRDGGSWYWIADHGTRVPSS